MRIAQPKWTHLLFASALVVFGALPATSAVPDEDAKVVEVINNFFKAMEAKGSATVNANDKDIDAKVTEAGKVAKDFFHKSHFNVGGDNLKPDRLRFSFKKAFSNLKFYQSPVKVSRVRKLTTTAIGFKETAEKGSSFDYFIDKKPDAAGRPAQIRVFINEKGEIKFDDVGSL